MEEKPEDLGALSSNPVSALTDAASALVETSIACVDRTVEEFEKLGYQRAQIKAIGITNQRETALVWSKST